VSYAQIIARREECTRKARNALLMFFAVCGLGLAYFAAATVHDARALTAPHTREPRQ
jgi:hypothetical protein